MPPNSIGNSLAKEVQAEFPVEYEMQVDFWFSLFRQKFQYYCFLTLVLLKSNLGTFNSLFNWLNPVKRLSNISGVQCSIGFHLFDQLITAFAKRRLEVSGMQRRPCILWQFQQWSTAIFRCLDYNQCIGKARNNSTFLLGKLPALIFGTWRITHSWLAWSKMDSAVLAVATAG